MKPRRTTAAAAHKTAEKHSRKVHAMVMPIKKATDDEAATSKVDPWEDLINDGRVVTPPFDMFGLATFPEYNSELNQAIEAMEVNIAGFGWQLVPHEGKRDPDDKEASPPEVSRERAVFAEFLAYGSEDGCGLTDIRRRLRRDLESTGNAYVELIDDSQATIVAYKHVPSYQMRLGIIDKEHTVYQEPRLVPDGAGDFKLIQVSRRRKFRRYVQLHRYGTGYKEVWFKELDDPRPISLDTGEVLTGEAAQDPTRLANPMLHMRIYSPRTPYGVPRYIGNLLSILGGRAAEEINYSTFRNNNMPSMLMMVSNGALTQGTIDRIQSFTESHIQGSDNWSKFLIIEADPDSEDGGQVKIEAQPLVGNQHSDALFQEYDKNTTDKIRRAFRLPPIFVGRSDDYTRATAETSRRIGDEQVFAPERDSEDRLWNRLLRKMGMQHHLFKTNTPNVTDDEDLIKVMKDGERSGAVTPRIARRILEDILGRPLPDMAQGIDLDTPFSLQMAEAVKNKAAPNEVGQQVTAVKQVTKGMMDNIIVSEMARDAGALPGLCLAPDTAAALAADVLTEVTVAKRADVEGRLFAVVDGSHCLALVSLTDARETGGEWTYGVDNVIALDPLTYTAPDAGDGFIDGVRLA
jgi:PBSX family phage portal protein